MTTTIYEAAGGREAFQALAHAWHQRCLADPELNHPFSHPGHPEHTTRLAAYWSEQLGGPPLYTGGLGDHTFVLRMHAGNGVHVDLDERAQVCFAQALDDAGFPDDARLRTTLKAWFVWATADMARYPDSPDDVPAGVPLPQWSWDGPVS